MKKIITLLNKNFNPGLNYNSFNAHYLKVEIRWYRTEDIFTS